MEQHLFHARRAIVALVSGLILVVGLVAPALAKKPGPPVTPPFCGNGVVDSSEQCDGSNLNGQTCQSQGFAGGTLSCTSSCTFNTSGCFAARFVDNGDGTITDSQTGLIWEKKSSDGSVHDQSNFYPWSISGTAPDGGAFTSFLAQLNDCSSSDSSSVSGGFAGHCDWRLPQLDELATIIDTNAAGCAQSPFPPCVDPAFNTGCTAGCTVTTVPACSCTESAGYWSATAAPYGTDFAWVAHFGFGDVFFTGESADYFVRAVRGGSGR
jgi:Protein of unknown function (DUF1566)